MSIETEPHDLVGVADPLGKGLGFLIPVFTRGRSNALRVERQGDNGLIEAFVDLQPQETPIIEVDGPESSVGAPAHWAFGFGFGDILLGQGENGRDALQARLGDSFFLERPLLAMEVAEFLRLSTDRVKYADLALQYLRKLSPKTADRWRDLSVLTPDIREALAAIKDWPLQNLQRLTARVESNIILIRGIDVDHDETFQKQASRHIARVVENLQPLYNSPADGWQLRFVKPELQPADRLVVGYDLSKLSALVYVADEDADVLNRVFSRPATDGIGLYTPRQWKEFAYQSSEFSGASFILFRANGQLGQVWSDDNRRADRMPIGLATRTSSGLSLAPSERAGLRRYQHPTVVVSKREIGAWGPKDGFAGETRNAIHLLSAAWHHGLRSHLRARTNFFLSARGAGPRLQDDACAQIYGRCWRLGVTRPDGILFDVGQREFDTGLHQRSLAEILFHNLRPLDVQNYRDPSSRARIDAAVLVTADDHTAGKDWRVYGEVVASMLENQNWSISGERNSRGPVIALTLYGQRNQFNISIGMERYKRRGRYPFEGLLERDLSDVKHIAVTEDAGASTVLTHLFERHELLATVRDLSVFSAQNGTIWSLLGSQMRRFSNSLPSRPRSHYFAMLTQAAIQHDSVNWEHAGRLVRAIHDQNFGEGTHLLCGRVLYEPDRAVAMMRLAPGLGPRSRELWSAGELDLRFKLTISRDGPEITPADVN
ncbi:hypothetical protein MESS2_1080012 [Mesorhizobium metallidurans STM 2683]|uniref:Uncharacterized protein n=1 Tax=Mesorhizobium metallidurans STM 2683 TaxID=1297569 RepID=M5EGL3_9HYPH|nr:hypothetical protein [Mesorhizobium metallidurans]CCV03512.1 hypothetical protein MESS2_1080012 [Mesorhizobium metallidurans STM 2683]